MVDAMDNEGFCLFCGTLFQTKTLSFHSLFVAPNLFHYIVFQNQRKIHLAPNILFDAQEPLHPIKKPKS